MTLGRTVAELRHGSAAFRPISNAEYITWYGFFSWRSKEIERRRSAAS